MENISIGIVITEDQRDSAEKVLIDNGIAEDDACSVLQALGYVLLNEELYPDC